MPAMVPSSALSAAAVPFLEDLYSRYQADPSSVDPSWTLVFRLVDELGAGTAPQGAQAQWIAARLRQLGHRMAASNPLSAGPVKLESLRKQAAQAAEQVPPSVDALLATYCGTLGVESAHVDDDGVAAWIQTAVESAPAPDAEALRQAHRKLVHAEEFESFLGTKFPGKKRFGAEGAEALVPLLDRVLRNAARDGVRRVVIGTMHRGRLNILANVLGKPLDALLAEFKGTFPFGPQNTSSADVSYHMGFETVLPETGLAVTLLPNPSHLEAVDPVVLGRVRALQDQLPPQERGTVLGIVLHTDAAVVGQGVVSEILQLGGPEGFATGGTVHVVVNNQLGFTTEPEESRTSRYCTGPWKAIDSLVLHANGDDIEAVIRAADLATGFRHSQGRDCVIDLVCYRRNGHNEMDEPRFTQPRLYQMLEGRPGVRQALESRLTRSALLPQADADSLVASYRATLDRAYAAMPSWRPQPESGAVQEPRGADGAPKVGQEILRALLERISTVPDHVTLDGKLQRLVHQRGIMDKGIPWAVGEALAFATLLTEGVPVRLSGQDVVRGAFSHRHFALTDIQDGKRHVSLQHLAPGQAPFSVVNSPLSEYAVLGFEYGYSLGAPNALTIWEAQFGDFANGAQIVVDQFLASGEEKWFQRSSLVLLLPHGLEGQGPEHSSARIERYLQLAALDNVRIAIPTTPANYFHLLRRQAHDSRRKPLVVFAPKTLLRLPAAVSTLEDLAAPQGFQPVLATTLMPAAEPQPADRILLCCGKIAYALEQRREMLQARGTTIVRLEELYPLPEAALGALFEAHPEAKLVWVQEEPANMGAWSWLDRRLEKLAQDRGHRHPRVQYCGRPEAASPAGSFHEHHSADQEKIVAAAFA
jgi:2-oxoglutarate dehydrogenase E1 component